MQQWEVLAAGGRDGCAWQMAGRPWEQADGRWERADRRCERADGHR